MEFNRSCWCTYEEGTKKEWLLSNGIGGFASSTLIGANTRRYHGLLVASLNPPTNRVLVLSALNESISVGGRDHDIYSCRTPGCVIEGFRYLEKVSQDPLPEYIFCVEDIIIRKKICMVYGENTVAVLYTIKNGKRKASLRLAPLMNFRDHHGSISKDDIKFESFRNTGTAISVKPGWWDGTVKLECSDGQFYPLNDCWFMGMNYDAEMKRGLSSVEDHYIPGYYEITVNPGEEKKFSFVCTIENTLRKPDARKLIKEEEARIKKVVSASRYKDEFAKALAVAADKFIVYRKSANSKTVIAGYPWFTDWGRDAMIALTGLTVTTRRFKDAEQILSTFAKYICDGLLPNVFPDGGQEPEYNTVDASLWYFEAVYKYVKGGGDAGFVRKCIYERLKDIIRHYIQGTQSNIRMDEDCLITAGSEYTQLTWMDAKVGDWIVTPRYGKTVEVNALWYNALKITAYFAKAFWEDGSYYDKLAEKVKRSFEDVFWNEEQQCLFDVVRDGYKDGKIRPNQIFAVSLSFPVIAEAKAKKIVKKVMDELYTPYGLRSLSKNDPEYKGMCTGNQASRDGAYHQGTVWVWPMGHFITAYRRVNNYSPESLKTAKDFFIPLKKHMEDACIGSISEIFDGDAPHTPRGCCAQAWSVGEVLRAYVEEVLNYQRKFLG